MLFKKEKKKYYKLKFSILIIFGLFCYGLSQFANKINNIKTNEETKTDAIVVLTGGKNRISTGVNLLKNKMAKKLFISGVYKDVDINKIFKLENIETKGLKDKISLGYLAENTEQNAKEISNWAKLEKINSIRLVTSVYHIPRSMLELQSENKDLKIIAHPVFSENIKLKKWYKWKGTAFLLTREYIKFLLTKTKIYINKKI